MFDFLNGRFGLVDDIAAHLKRYSVLALLALLAIPAAWLEMSPELKQGLPEGVAMKISIVVAALGFVGSFLKQRLTPADFGLAPQTEMRHFGMAKVEPRRFALFWPFVILLAGGIIAAASSVAALSELRTLKTDLAVRDSCLGYLASSGLAGAVTDCNVEVQSLYRTAQDANACDDNLDLATGTLPAFCSATVRQLFNDLVVTQAQLEAATADHTQAIARAEVRGRAQTLRKAQNASVLAASPRQPDGSVVCDAVCLRARFEAAPQP